jgi:hypothetical protein
LPRVSPSPIRDPRYRPPLTESGRAAGVFHFLVAVGGWVVFALFWRRVFYRTPSAEGVAGVLVVAILLVVSVSLTAAWIRHNLILSRRFAYRRLHSREASRDWSRDVLGRPVTGPGWEILQMAPEVEIDLDPRTGAKIYRAF